MAIFDLFSKRQKQNNSDPFQYTSLPESFRIQVIHILHSAAGDVYTNSANLARAYWNNVHDTISRELGRFHLGSRDDNGKYKNCIDFLLNSNTENCLNIIDYAFQLLNTHTRLMEDYQRRDNNINQYPDDAINELNHRFREHNIGYQFENGELFKINSQFIHEEVVKRALVLLKDNKFIGAEEEFMKAYDHFKHGRHKESIAEALKSFESTMKIICNRHKWTYKPSDTANKLIEILVINELIPSYIQQHFTSLRSTLESGIPVIRNKTSGHGQGEEPVHVPVHFVSYALNISASNIVLLVECSLKLKG